VKEKVFFLHQFSPTYRLGYAKHITILRELFWDSNVAYLDF